MGRMKEKGKSGQAKNFITRTQAVRKLQISLADFRRLCIFKGIFPREPRNKKKASKSATPSTTFYYARDIQYLQHEPLLQKFREHKALAKKIARALGRNEPTDAVRLERVHRPRRLALDHVIKERYPTFADALRDLDDALSMLFLFASLPATATVPARTIALCQRLCLEFQHYVIVAHALRKSFLSIKGIYYQARIAGEDVLWLAPYRFVQRVPADVDFRIMGTFVQFYAALLGFVNFRLYTSVGLVYPPRFNVASDDCGGELRAFTLEGRPLGVVDGDAAAKAIQQAERNTAPIAGKTNGDAGHDKQAQAQQQRSAPSKEELEAVVQRIAAAEAEEATNGAHVEAEAAGAAKTDAAEPEAAPPAASADASADATADATADDPADKAVAADAGTALEISTSVDDFGAPIAADGDVLLQPSPAADVAPTLFARCTFYLSRETPRAPLEFLLRAFGCTRIGWDAVQGDGAFTHDEAHPAITHQVVDRPPLPPALALRLLRQSQRRKKGGKGGGDNNDNKAGGTGGGGGETEAATAAAAAAATSGRTIVPGRIYVQPQWVWDCVNAGQLLRPDQYAPGAELPPHLSPWVKPTRGQYDPTLPLVEQETADDLQDIGESGGEEQGGNAEDGNEGKATPDAVKRSRLRLTQGNDDDEDDDDDDDMNGGMDVADDDDDDDDDEEDVESTDSDKPNHRRLVQKDRTARKRERDDDDDVGAEEEEEEEEWGGLSDDDDSQDEDKPNRTVNEAGDAVNGDGDGDEDDGDDHGDDGADEVGDDEDDDPAMLHQRELEAEAAGVAPPAAARPLTAAERQRRAAARQRRAAAEELERRKMMMSRKKRKLLDKMLSSNRRRDAQALALRRKRRKLENQQHAASASSTTTAVA